MKPYETIMVGVDFSPLASVAIQAGADLGRRCGSKRLHLVHVSRPPIWPAEPLAAINPKTDAWEVALAAARLELAELAVPETSLEVTREVRIGPTPGELVDAARRQRADLIVVASRGHGAFGRFVLGSVASTLIRAAPCPVLVVGPDRSGRAPIRDVIAAIDGSPISKRVLRHAIELAACEHGRVRVVSVVELLSLAPRGAASFADGAVLQQALDAYAERHRRRISALIDEARVPGVEITAEISAQGLPREILLEVAERTKPDLLVLGTSGHNAWQRMFLGSTATRVLAGAPCPILTVPYDAELDAERAAVTGR